jgi:hypothetical protein
MTFALSIAAGRIPSEPNRDANEAQRFVGNRRVSHSITPEEREEAIELAELREAWYEHQGFPIQAGFMRTLIDDLIASRNQPGEQA